MVDPRTTTVHIAGNLYGQRQITADTFCYLHPPLRDLWCLRDNGSLQRLRNAVATEKADHVRMFTIGQKDLLLVKENGDIYHGELDHLDMDPPKSVKKFSELYRRLD